MRNLRLSIAILATALVGGTSSRAFGDVKPAAIFADHMVLQQSTDATIWGTADAGEQVTVTLGEQKAAATAGADGKWRVKIPTAKSGGPVDLSIAGKNTVQIHDVLLGEVWLCSGQSNMDFTVSKAAKYFAGTLNEEEEIAAADYPQIRTFVVDFKLATEPQADVTGHWLVCSPKTAGQFSACAYFFGRDLFQARHEPIGLVTSAYGASSCEAWTSRAALAANPELAPALVRFDDDLKDFATDGNAARNKAALAAWEKASADAQAAGKTAPRKPKAAGDPRKDQHKPTLLYNAMIAPIAPYNIRGVIWYQGESNGVNCDQYHALINTMIQSWRREFDQGDFAFLTVLLAANNPPATQPVQARSQIAVIREAQADTLALPNTGIASAVDIGDAKNVHPKNKQEIGRRLGLSARALVYHEAVEAFGPMYDSTSVEGGTLRVKFRHATGGLEAKGDQLTGFAIAGADGNWATADAKIDGETVVLSSKEVAAPTAVRYCWADNPPLNLFNKAGLPAIPFRSDREQVK